MWRKWKNSCTNLRRTFFFCFHRYQPRPQQQMFFLILKMFYQTHGVQWFFDKFFDRTDRSITMVGKEQFINGTFFYDSSDDKERFRSFVKKSCWDIQNCLEWKGCTFISLKAFKHHEILFYGCFDVSICDFRFVVEMFATQKSVLDLLHCT